MPFIRRLPSVRRQTTPSPRGRLEAERLRRDHNSIPHRLRAEPPFGKGQRGWIGTQSASSAIEKRGRFFCPKEDGE